MEEHIEDSGHPSRNIPNEAYPDDSPRPEASPHDLPPQDETHRDDGIQSFEEWNGGIQGAGRIERPEQVATPNEVPPSLQSFIRGPTSSTNVGLFSSEDVHDPRNRRLSPLQSPRQSPQRPPQESPQEPPQESSQESSQQSPQQPSQQSPQGTLEQLLQQPPNRSPQRTPPPAYVAEEEPDIEMMGMQTVTQARPNWKSMGFIGGSVIVVVALVVGLGTWVNGKPEK